MINLNYDFNRLTYYKIEKVEKPVLSIIIRTKNEEKDISTCLDQILKQEIEINYEIIVIDSGSMDNTILYAERYPVTIVKMPPEDFNFGFSINLGIHLSKGDFVCFVSAHAIPYNRFWLFEMMKHFKDEKVCGVYGKQIPYDDTNYIEKRNLSRTFGEIQIVQKLDKSSIDFVKDRNMIKFSNASSCIRKSVALEIPFKNIVASEDREWAFRALSAGYKIVYEPKSLIYHAHNETIEQWYKRIYINAKAVNEFTGFKIKFIYKLPLLLLNMYRDFMFCKKNKIRFSFKFSHLYWKTYVKAYWNVAKEVKK